MLDRQAPHPDAGRGEDRVGDRGGDRRHAGLAQAADGMARADELDASSHHCPQRARLPQNDGTRFLLRRPGMADGTSEFVVIVNWPALLK
jgi:hypothetical protein